jgi:hypothetical protein
LTPWRFWVPGKDIHDIPVKAPVLASWMKSTHPDQIRLTAYLEEVKSHLPLPAGPEPLFLALDVGLLDQSKLLSHHDLENYLTPLFGRQCLDPNRFVLVLARKRIGRPSRIRVGYVVGPVIQDLSTWHSFETQLACGVTSGEHKASLRDQIESATNLLPDGPVEVRMGWRCSSKRNWTNLWKPTGDVMGPILGATRSEGFNPRDDRIVALELQREVDDRLQNALQLGLWWRSEVDGSEEQR